MDRAIVMDPNCCLRPVAKSVDVPGSMEGARTLVYIGSEMRAGQHCHIYGRNRPGGRFQCHDAIGPFEWHPVTLEDVRSGKSKVFEEGHEEEENAVPARSSTCSHPTPPPEPRAPTKRGLFPCDYGAPQSDV